MGRCPQDRLGAAHPRPATGWRRPSRSYTQSRGQASVRYVSITNGVVVAVLPHHDWIQEGTHAQVGAITDLAFTVTAVGPPHNPVFTCSATCRHADGEISGTGQGPTKSQARSAAAEALLAELAGPVEPAMSSRIEALARYATSPVGVADRLLPGGLCHPVRQGAVPPGASRWLAAARGTAGSPVPAAHAVGTGTHPEQTPTRASGPGRTWPRPSWPRWPGVTSIPPWTLPAATCGRLCCPTAFWPGTTRTLDEADAREFTDVVAEHLLRTPGAAHRRVGSLRRPARAAARRCRRVG